METRSRLTDLTKAPAIYHRAKDRNTSKWLNPKRIEEGRGLRTSDLKPPFSIRPVIDGKQVWWPLAAQSFTEAKAEAIAFYTKLAAHERGAAIQEVDDANRITIQAAVADYLDHKQNEVGRRPGTISVYRSALLEFADNTKVRYIDEVTEPILRRYLRFMKDPVDGKRRGYSSKTISTRMTVIFSLLKKHKIDARVDLPSVPKKLVQKFSQAEIKKLFAAMTEKEKFRYGFFLDTGCREQEVMFATWGDIDWDKKEYMVTAKPEAGFEVKSHEERRVPLSDDMIRQLRKHSENPAHPRWVFINGDSNPESHFLDKFKRIALKAGVNCGHCVTTRSQGHYEKKNVEVTCKTHPVCEKMYLHRFRKTRATVWSECGINVRTIQQWLGHSSLEITQLYLGVTDSSELREQINRAQRKAYGD
jgi:integrase/recombinase XerD